MPGENCSNYGLTVSPRSKYKGVSIFNIPSAGDSFDKELRQKLLAVITRTRKIDDAVRERIKAKKLSVDVILAMINFIGVNLQLLW